MINKITCKKQLIFLSLAAIIALVAAYISQYFFGLNPCPLCLYQRIPFAIIILLCLSALVFPKSQKIILILCAMALLANCVIAFYHVGVEQKIFKGLSSCSGSELNEIDNLADLENAILNIDAVKCDKPQFIFLKLSMAAWNFLYCLALLLGLWKFSKLARRNF
jgi:disulfide bond formation protein DsbB